MSVTVPIWNGISNYVTGSSVFGYFDGDPEYIADSDQVASWCAKRLGYPVLDVELQDIHFYSAFEEAILEYSSLVNTYDLIDNFLDIQGASTGSNMSGLLKRPTLNGTIKVSEAYGSEAGTGGNLTWHSGSIDIERGVQTYDLASWASSEGITGSIEIRRVFNRTPPAVTNFFYPFAGLGGGVTGMDVAMWGGMGGGAHGGGGGGFNYLMMPVYVDMLRLQAIELNQATRRSNYSFELINNTLKIFPIPTANKKVWFQYVKNEDRFSLDAGEGAGKVSGFHNANYQVLPYRYVNTIGRRWIFKYALALCKETLGLIRGKYTSIPIPGSDSTLNGTELLQQAQTEQEMLREELKEALVDIQKRNQLERKQLESANINTTLDKVPLPFRIG